MIIRHLEVVAHLDGQNVESCTAIDEGPGNLHIADDSGTKHWEDASCSRTVELVRGAERDGARGPPKKARGLKLGEDCVHLASKLLEDALRGWGLGTAQDASDSTRILEAPSPLVLMMVVIPSWQRQQRRKACVALRAVLARLILQAPSRG